MMTAYAQPSPLPLAASRFLTRAAFWLTAIAAVILLLATIAIAGVLPMLVPDRIDEATGLKISDLQPWLGLVLLGASAMLALAARLFHRLWLVLSSVADGDAFTVDNSRRLRHIGWLMIAMQIVGLLTGLAGNHLPADQNLGQGFELSFSGLLAAFLAFVVAQLFEQARGYRDDLEGTV